MVLFFGEDFSYSFFPCVVRLQRPKFRTALWIFWVLTGKQARPHVTRQQVASVLVYSEERQADDGYD